jgi:hypothetical protein
MACELASQGIDVLLVKPGPARTHIWQSLGTVQERLAQVITNPDMAQLYEADFAAVSERGGGAQCGGSTLLHHQSFKLCCHSNVIVVTKGTASHWPLRLRAAVMQPLQGGLCL